MDVPTPPGGDSTGRRRYRRARTRLAAGYRQLEPLRRRLRARFEVDTRALAAMRIALGAIVLFDLLHRAQYLELFYTDAGLYPRSVRAAASSSLPEQSLHMLSGALWFQALLFVVAGAFALAFVVGYRTRLVGVVTLLLLVSLQARNPAVLNGADRLLRVLVFVALLTPLGERWSVDALRRGSARRTVAGATTAALLAQPIAVFSQNAYSKYSGETWYAGEALSIALSRDTMTIYLGNHLGAYPALLEVLTYGWVVLLAGSSVFLLATVGRARAVAALAYLGAFAGMAVTVAVGLFPFVLAAAVLPFLTTPFWDALGRRVPGRWRERRPARSALGPLAGPPVEQRALEALRARGYEDATGFAREYGRSLLAVLGAMTLVWIILFSAGHVDLVDVPEPVEESLPHEQRWLLYAPDPGGTYGWFVTEAELADGSTVDALGDGNVSFDRPPDPATEFETFRHRKFMETVSQSADPEAGHGPEARRYGEWACERANERHDGAATRVTLHWVIQAGPDTDGPEDPYTFELLERDCADAITGRRDRRAGPMNVPGQRTQFPEICARSRAANPVP